MLAESIQTGLRAGVIKPKMFERVNVDTTVEEKSIRFPTDARLYDRMREHLVKEAQKRGLTLRQTYRRVGRKILLRQSRYAHVQQFKRARKMTRHLRTLLGRVVRDIQRKVEGKVQGVLKEKLELANKLLKQQRQDSKKIYSIHEPHVECICKGKIHKRYEFGCKVSVVSTSRGNWILTSQALHGNPYDGKTLVSSLQQAQRVCGSIPKQAFCDLGYRGHEKAEDTTIEVVPRKRKHLGRSLRHWMNRRAAIEPIIGHLKADHRFERNRLKGKLGDQLNALLSACGFNFRKLMRAFFCTNWNSFFQSLRFSFNIQLSSFNSILL
jgi:IS5 family transposase